MHLFLFKVSVQLNNRIKLEKGVNVLTLFLLVKKARVFALPQSSHFSITIIEHKFTDVHCVTFTPMRR